MDLKQVILQEHSRSQAEKIARYIGSDARRFKRLVDVFLAGPYRVTQRTAWPLSLCVETDPSLVMPYLKKILHHLRKPGIHDAVKRNTIRMLQFIEIPKSYHGEVADICFTFLQDAREPVAIRAFSMSVLAGICKHNPDLKRELKIILEDQLPYAKPAFVSRAKKVLKEIAG